MREFQQRIKRGIRQLWNYTHWNTVAKRLGILSQQGHLRPGLRYAADETVVIASGERITVKSIVDVPLKIQRTGEIVNGKLCLLRQGSSLFGISHIKNVKTLKVKYR